MCFFLTLLLLGPRAILLIWWIVNPVLWAAAFDTFIWPLLGFLFLPWTTLMYVLVAEDGITGGDWFWLTLRRMPEAPSAVAAASRDTVDRMTPGRTPGAGRT